VIVVEIGLFVECDCRLSVVGRFGGYIGIIEVTVVVIPVDKPRSD